MDKKKRTTDIARTPEETIEQENQSPTKEQDYDWATYLDTGASMLLTDQEKQDQNYLYSLLLLGTEEIIRLTLQRTEAQLTSKIRILSLRQNYILRLMGVYTSQPTEEEQKLLENITKSSKDLESTSDTSKSKNL